MHSEHLGPQGTSLILRGSQQGVPTGFKHRQAMIIQKKDKCGAERGFLEGRGVLTSLSVQRFQAVADGAAEVED